MDKRKRDRNRYRAAHGIPLDLPPRTYRLGKPTLSKEERKKRLLERANQRYFMRARPDLKGKVFEDGRWRYPKGRRRKSKEYTYERFKASALKRELACSISQEEYVSIRSKPCHYCGGALPKLGSGIDRADNSIGYVPGNCVPCCSECNWAKGSSLSAEEWALIVRFRKFQAAKV